VDSAIRQKNAKVVWNGSKAAEYFFNNEAISAITPEWSQTLISALLFSVMSHQNNKVKISCLDSLNTSKGTLRIKRIGFIQFLALKLIREDPSSQIQLLQHLDHLSATFQKIETTGVDYRSKMRDMVIETMADLTATDRNSDEVTSLVKTRYVNFDRRSALLVQFSNQTLALPFQDYVDTNGLEALDKLLKSHKANRSLLNPIISILAEKDKNANEVVFDADSIPEISPYLH